MCIILGTVYIDNRGYYKFNGEHLSYHDALKKLNLITLNERRIALTNKYAIETARNEKHNNIFIKKQSMYITTRNMYVLKDHYCRTERYFRSAIPHMTRTLNGVLLSKRKFDQ